MPSSRRQACAALSGPTPPVRRITTDILTAASKEGRRPLVVSLMAMMVVAAGLTPLGIAPAAGQTVSARKALAGLDPLDDLVDEAASRFSVPAPWVRLVMRAESARNLVAVSPKGALGLMQIMPKTFEQLRQTYGLGPDPLQPRDNILAGAAYLREMYDRYGSPGFLAAYNAGPARYERHLATGLPLPEETQLYLARLAPMVTGAQAGRTLGAPDPLAWTNAPLFTSRAAGPIVDGLALPKATGFKSVVRELDDVARTDALAMEPRSNGLFVQRAPDGSAP